VRQFFLDQRRAAFKCKDRIQRIQMHLLERLGISRVHKDIGAELEIVSIHCADIPRTDLAALNTCSTLIDSFQ
jgi:hypothetical protein